MKSRIMLLAVLPILALPILAARGSSANTAAAYKVDGGHSSVLFRIKHLNVAYFYGRFNQVSGEYTLDGDAGSMEITIQTASVDSNSADRDRHLKSPDFFNAKQYPTIQFKSTSVKQLAGNEYEASGNLTFHGVTKPLTVKVEKTGEGPGMRGEYRGGFETTFNFKRSDFGMDYMIDKLGDDIRVIVSIEGIKK